MSLESPTERSLLLGESDRDAHGAGRGSSSHIALRVGAAMYSFVMMGFFQSSLGVMLQPLSQHYSLSDLHVSLIFIAGPVGYVIGAQCSSRVHERCGQKGIAVLAPMLHLFGALAVAGHPSFVFVLGGLTAAALGAGLLDPSWCVWGASQSNANTVTGLLQGAFSVGAAAGPFLAGTVLPAWNRPWYDWYYALVAASVLELCTLLFAFRHENALKYREEKQPVGASTDVEGEPRAMLGYLATWLCALYLLAYVGTEAAISGWVVSFMIRQRDVAPSSASMASSGFWGGMAAGRFTLGIVTDRLGVELATLYYFLAAIALQLVFASVHTSLASITLMALIGFVMGPMFASGIVSLTRVLPARLHVPAVAFAVSAGQIGAALLPFGIGAFIDGLGIGLYPVVIVVLVMSTLMIWIPILRQRPTKSASHGCGNEEADEDDATTP